MNYNTLTMLDEVRERLNGRNVQGFEKTTFLSYIFE